MIRQLSDFKDEEALDVLADILDPVVAICQNAELAEAVRGGKSSKIKLAQIAIKANKSEVMQILSILSDEDDYHCNGISIMKDAMTLLQDKELTSFFSSQALTEEQTSSASASQSTMEKKK